MTYPVFLALIDNPAIPGLPGIFTGKRPSNMRIVFTFYRFTIQAYSLNIAPNAMSSNISSSNCGRRRDIR
jgi:hypothetical protein